MGESWTGGRVEGGSWLWEGGAAWTADRPPPPIPGNCLLIGLGGGWGKAPCEQERGALCEMQPEIQLPEELVTGETYESQIICIPDLSLVVAFQP